MEGLKSGIHKYYNAVESHVLSITELTESAKKPCNSILNQSKILRAVLPEKSYDDTVFASFPNFREKIIFNITKSLEYEVGILNEIREKICSSNDQLLQRQRFLEKTYQESRKKNLLDFSQWNSASPSLEHIIEWSANIWNFYQAFYLQISQALKFLDFGEEESVSALIHSFEEDPKLKKHINKIRSYKLHTFEFICN